ncbi:hypothetical protein AMC82_CH00200 [Rhizobium phaseoli]|nr:hypothetical protein AMC84_CH00200 [Rhizobium phaseoli]ANL70244.1 hypothetical protein AMC83_CH00203 [Rhizobium phaseoli]ANL76727.1 hypothetical protein AMC82_CH00200 [Rhizobium phaseoli]
MCPPRSTKSAFPPYRTSASIARNTPLRLLEMTARFAAQAGFAHPLRAAAIANDLKDPGCHRRQTDAQQTGERE